MDLKDQFRCLVSGYFGIVEMDNYDLKVYVLKDIENYIKSFIELNPIIDFDYYEEANLIKDRKELIRKLQDSLLVLPKVNASMELILLVKAKIKEIKEQEM